MVARTMCEDKPEHACSMAGCVRFAAIEVVDSEVLYKVT